MISNATFREFVKRSGQKSNNLHYGINYYVHQVTRNYTNKFEYADNIQYSPVQRDVMKQRNAMFDQAIQASKLNCLKIELTAKSPYISGLGLDHVTETGMILHHTYGVPYLPGTMIKGVVNQWLHKIAHQDASLAPLLSLTGIEESPEDETEGAKSLLTFHDCFFNEMKIKDDIMTPHFSEYYQNSNFIEESSPNPVKFKVVQFENTAHLWVTWSNQVEVDDKNKLGQLICKAIKETGLGAKTTVGYGYFDAQYIGEKAGN